MQAISAYMQVSFCSCRQKTCKKYILIYILTFVLRCWVTFDPAKSGIREQVFVHHFILSLKSRIKSTINRVACIPHAMLENEYT